MAIALKNLLVISYYFPPAAVVGANRIKRFVKHFPNYGWQSIVVTVDDKYYDLHDTSLCLATQDNLQIFRTSMIELYDFHSKHELTSEGGLRAIGLKHKETKNVFRKMLNNYLSIPDTRSGWIPAAVLESLRIMRRRPIDAILTTSYPYSAHIIGMILKVIKGKVWLADFRDPWAEYAFLYPNTELHKKTAYFLERKVIEASDVVIANTLEARDRMCERYNQFAAKIKSIPNGYDQEEFDQAKLVEALQGNDTKFVILHAGTIQADKERRYPVGLFQAISKLIGKYPSFRKTLVVKFIGHLHFTIDLQSLAKECGVEDNIIEVGYVNHVQAIQEMISANILLLIHHAQGEIDRLYSTIPAKAYEYFAAKKPILCLTSNGAIGEMISEKELGVSVNPLNVDGMVAALEDLFVNYNLWLAKVSSSDFSSQFEAKR